MWPRPFLFAGAVDRLDSAPDSNEIDEDGDLPGSPTLGEHEEAKPSVPWTVLVYLEGWIKPW